MTTLQRFVLDRSTLAGAVSMAGLTPSADSALPAPKKPNQKKLEGAGAVWGGGLDPSLRAALAALSVPAKTLTVSANSAGRPIWTETCFVATGESIIGWSERDGEFDIAVIGDRPAAVLLIDEALKLTDLPAAEPSEPLALSAHAYVTLLATADLIQESALQHRIDRLSQQSPPRLDPDALLRMVATGLRSVDTRWAVTTGALSAPVPFDVDAEALSAGLGELRAAGLLTGGAAEPHASAAGLDLFDALARIVRIGSIELSVPGPAVARVTVLRCLASIWTGIWGIDEAGATDVTLVAHDHRTALGVVENLLDLLSEEVGATSEPVEAEAVPEGETEGAIAFCSACGKEFADDASFCTGCGAARS